MDKELADDMTRRLLLKDIEKYPLKNDFGYPVKFGGKDYIIVWRKDINVSNPKWSISIELSKDS